MIPVKVSVIVPVYNTEKYLVEAISSILNQTLSEIEVIAINDGSTDNSLQLLQNMSATDARLKVITYPDNVGVSVCRNTGIDVALGEFVYFFDSDDILEPDCLEQCYVKSVSDKLDFLFFDGVSFFQEGVQLPFSRSYQRTQYLVDKVSSGKDKLLELNSCKGYSCSVCLCVIRLEFLKRLNLRFYPGILFEDVLFSIILYLSAQRVSFIRSSFFRRRIRANSTMTSSISQKSIDYRLTVCREIIRYKQQFPEKDAVMLLNLEVRNVLKFLVKNLLRSLQFKLLYNNALGILRCYISCI